MELDYILAGGYINIPCEWEDLMRSYFTAYIWYRDIKVDNDVKVRRCWCSVCGAQFDNRTGEISNCRHRDSARCPHCNTLAYMIAAGRMRNYHTLNAKGRAVFADKLTRDTVLIRGFFATIEYNEDDVQGEITMIEDVRYILTPGKAEMTRHNSFTDRWEICNPCEPWSLTTNYGLTSMSINHYVFANPDELIGTFCEYADIVSFAECVQPETLSGNMHDQPAYMRYLTAYCRYPVIEHLIKNGCYDIIGDLIYSRRKNGTYLDWRAKTIDGFCRLPKKDAMRWIRESCGDMRVRQLMNERISYDEAKKFADRYSYYSLKNVCGNHGEADILRTVRYLTKVNNDIHVLDDYWSACEYLGRDLTNDRVRYPKNLREAHDTFTAAEQRLREEFIEHDVLKARSTYKNEILPRYKSLYEYYTDKYCAMVPEQLSDIALEGKNMRHCVGGYIDRHAQGKTIIIFIRDPMYPLIPRWTAEISPDGMLRQVQGFNNREENKPKGDAKEFINRWLNIIKERIRAQNKRKLKESEITE